VNPGKPIPQSCNSSVIFIKNSTVAIRRISTFIFILAKNYAALNGAVAEREEVNLFFKLIV
jgi:hypothetical protein